jgi:Uma2 family endonuclease
MAIAETSHAYTANDLLTMPNGDRFEIIEGELKERIMSYLSSSIAIRLAALLRQWVAGGHPGYVAGSDGGFTIFPWAPRDVRMPDVSYISAARLPEMPATGWVAIAPEFVVEVVSPTDLASDVQKKADDYIRADGTTDLVRPGAAISGEQVLPGFSAAIDDLFADVPQAAGA